MQTTVYVQHNLLYHRLPFYHTIFSLLLYKGFPMAKKEVVIGPARWAILKAFCRATRTLAIYDPVHVQRVTGPKGTLLGVRAEYCTGKGNLAVDYIARGDLVSLRFYGS